MTTEPLPRPLRPRTPLASRILPTRLFYCWYIALGCAAMMMVAGGVGYYGLAVFLEPLQEEHGWSNSAVSGATSMFFLIGGIMGAVVGPYVDRYGPRMFQIIGVVMTGALAMFIGGVSALWQLYLLYALIAVGNGLASAVSINAIMSRWWVRRRAKAMSISATGISLGGVILTPLGAWMVDKGGIALAAPVLGGAVLVVALPMVLWVLVFDPREMGLLPDGDRSVEEAEQRVGRPGVGHDLLGHVEEGPSRLDELLRGGLEVLEPFVRPLLVHVPCASCRASGTTRWAPNATSSVPARREAPVTARRRRVSGSTRARR